MISLVSYFFYLVSYIFFTATGRNIYDGSPSADFLCISGDSDDKSASTNQEFTQEHSHYCIPN